MVPSGINIGKEQLNIIVYANDIRRYKETFCRNRKHCQKVRTADKPRKNKIYDSGTEKQFKTKQEN
jgi:hypothetical protein